MCVCVCVCVCMCVCVYVTFECSLRFFTLSNCLISLLSQQNLKSTDCFSKQFFSPFQKKLETFFFKRKRAIFENLIALNICNVQIQIAGRKCSC